MKKGSIKQEFGVKIKALRTAKGLTQADLAAEIDVDIRTIRRIETGNYNPTLEIIAALASVFRLTVSDLFK